MRPGGIKSAPVRLGPQVAFPWTPVALRVCNFPMTARRLLCAILALVAVITVAPAASAAKKPPKPQPIVVSALPVDVTKDVWAWPTMDINQWPAHTYQPIGIFGRPYQGKVEASLFTTMLKIGTPVLAAYPGVVKQILQQPESCDAELYIFSPTGGIRTASYDHVRPTVKVGDVVKVGQQIATIPAWECDEPFGGVELMVMEETSKGLVYRCPLSILDPKKAAAVRAQVRSVMDRWNAFAGSAASAYTPEDLTRGACAATSLPVKQ
ncbi:MAG: hypothetical protein RLZ94_911 [Actinomycetota bacterium]